MPSPQLTALSPLDGRYFKQTRDLSNYFSEYALIKYRVFVEFSYLKALIGLKPLAKRVHDVEKAKQDLDEMWSSFNEQEAEKIKSIEEITNHDVKAVEYYLIDALKSKGYSTPLINLVHFGLTSEDVNNVAYALMLKEASEAVFTPMLSTLQDALKELSLRYKQNSMLSRTHGQSATPTTMGKEFANFYVRIKRQQNSLLNFSYLAKLNGAVGNFNAHQIALPEVNWPQFSQNFIQSLGLENNAYTNQIEPHDFIANLSHIFISLNTILIDLSRDVWQYISLDYFKLKTVKGEVGSSTMPHKVNPIDFENAEGNLGLANGILIHLATKLPISRLQRDLSDSTTLRNLGVGFGHSLLAYKSLLKGLNKLELNDGVITKDLDDRFEVLAEAIQSVMRIENIESPYEQLKKLTRGQAITKDSLERFIQELSISTEAKQKLLMLSPINYTGLASVLCSKLN